MNPYDGQPEVLWNIASLIDAPELDAEELGKIALTIEGFVGSGLISEHDAAELLAPRRGDPR